MSDPVRSHRRSGLALARNTTAGDQTGRPVVEVLVLVRFSVRRLSKSLGFSPSIETERRGEVNRTTPCLAGVGGPS